jgi:hypothetical protein
MGIHPVAYLFNVDGNPILFFKFRGIIGCAGKDAVVASVLKADIPQPKLLIGETASLPGRERVFDPEVTVSGLGALEPAEKIRQSLPGFTGYLPKNLVGRVPVAGKFTSGDRLPGTAPAGEEAYEAKEIEQAAQVSRSYHRTIIYGGGTIMNHRPSKSTQRNNGGIYETGRM